MAISTPRYTVYGSDDLEHYIDCIVNQVARCVQQSVPSRNLRVLALTGGYGRGEGGVVRHVDDAGTVKELPHNNLDFLLLTHGLSRHRRKTLQSTLDSNLASIRRRHALGIDLSIISANRLLLSPCRLIWYDMRHGHKVILGDESFISSLRQFRVSKIPSWDMRNLLMNRGTLLLLNQWLTRDGRTTSLTSDCKQRQQLCRHAMKAVIGYGDAVLYSYGQYHWSYLEKQRRMRELSETPAEFRQLYEQALRFRLEGSDREMRSWDWNSWFPSIRSLLQSQHLAFECWRLRRTIGWKDYVRAAIRESMLRTVTGPIELLRGASRLAGRRGQGTFRALGATPMLRVASWVLPARESLSLVFPALAYRSQDQVDMGEALKSVATAFLGTPDHLQQLAEYIRIWGHHIDRNLFNHVSAPTEDKPSSLLPSPRPEHLVNTSFGPKWSEDAVSLQQKECV